MAGPLVPALLAAGVAVSAYGTYQAGQAREDAANVSARTAEQQAQAAKLKAKIEIRNLRREQGQLRQTQIARASAGEFGTSGSAGVAVQETAHLTELDVEAIKQQSRFAASYLQQQAANLRATGAAEATAANIATLGTLLTGGAQVYQAYLDS